MPNIALIFNPLSVNPVTLDASYTLTQIVLHENFADVSFTVKILNVENALIALNNTTWGAQKLILETDDKNTESTLTVGNLRISSNILYNLLKDNLLQKTLIQNIDQDLKRGFTVQELPNVNNAVKFDQNTIEFSKNVRYSTGAASSSLLFSRQVVTNNVPFVSFLHCALKEFLQDKEARPGTVPPEFLQFYNKDYMQMITVGYLLYFQTQCAANNVSLILSIDLNRNLDAVREKMMHNFDSLLSKPTFSYEQTKLLDHTALNSVPSSSTDESRSQPTLRL